MTTFQLKDQPLLELAKYCILFCLSSHILFLQTTNNFLKGHSILNRVLNSRMLSSILIQCQSKMCLIWLLLKFHFMLQFGFLYLFVYDCWWLWCIGDVWFCVYFSNGIKMTTEGLDLLAETSWYGNVEPCCIIYSWSL